MNTALQADLLAMQAEDLRVREQLAQEGLLDNGYEPRMEEIHTRHAERLEAIVDQHGWPGRSLAGDEGAEAAWRILQHAISRPDLMRKCLPLMNEAAANGEIPEWQPAYVLDRIRFFENRPQVYGTQYDWDAEGYSSLWLVEDPETVNERRKSVGLPPLADAGARARVHAPLSPDKLTERREAMEAWARSVGWRT